MNSLHQRETRNIYTLSVRNLNYFIESKNREKLCKETIILHKDLCGSAMRLWLWSCSDFIILGKIQRWLQYSFSINQTLILNQQIYIPKTSRKWANKFSWGYYLELGPSLHSMDSTLENPLFKIIILPSRVRSRIELNTKLDST